MKRISILCAVLVGTAFGAQAATFYSIAGVTTTNTVDFFAKDNMIQGAGVGFDAAEPHNQVPGALTWVTNNPAGAGDYYSVAPAPVIWFDLGLDVVLTERVRCQSDV